MKRILGLSFVAIVGLSFGGCEKDPRSIEYYRNNIDIAEKRLEECKKMERMSEKTKEDCQNAAGAILRGAAQK